MNIIFLDIDGVICTEKSKQALGFECFDPCSCMLLLNLAKKYDCKFVIHSTWRYIPHGYDDFQRSFIRAVRPRGYNYLFPKQTGKHITIGDGYVGKCQSIQNWLDKYGDDVDDFLIIDDENIVTPDHTDLEGHFLKVENHLDGFGCLDWLRADKYFGRNKNEVKQV